jgi:hypothetical protein
MQSHMFTPCGHLCVCSDCASLIMGTTKMCPTCRTPASQVCVCVFLCVCVGVSVSLSVSLSGSVCLWFSLFDSVLWLCEFIGNHKHLD